MNFSVHQLVPEEWIGQKNWTTIHIHDTTTKSSARRLSVQHQKNGTSQWSISLLHRNKTCKQPQLSSTFLQWLSNRLNVQLRPLTFKFEVPSLHITVNSTPYGNPWQHNVIRWQWSRDYIDRVPTSSSTENTSTSVSKDRCSLAKSQTVNVQSYISMQNISIIKHCDNTNIQL